MDVAYALESGDKFQHISRFFVSLRVIFSSKDRHNYINSIASYYFATALFD